MSQQDLFAGLDRRENLRLQAALRHSTGRQDPLAEVRRARQISMSSRAQAENARITTRAAASTEYISPTVYSNRSANLPARTSYPSVSPTPELDLPTSKGYFHNPSPWAQPRSNFMSASEADMQLRENRFAKERTSIMNRLNASNGPQGMLPLVDQTAIQRERNKAFMDIVSRGNKSAMAPVTSTEVATRGPGAIARAKAFMNPGRLISPQTKAIWNVNKAFVNINVGAAKLGYGMANATSKVLLKASIPQIGVAAGITAAVGYGAMSALGVSGSQLAGAASSFNESMKQAARPVYGYSALGQSTQGLVFGLNSRRTA
jgi:hypothetical protein